jgi:phage/conjugal plasmid C-4 type zinc finger TraR family protein
VSKGFGGSDFAQVQTELATSQSIQRILEAEKEQAEHARDLQAKGAYGKCEDCGVAIPPERLEVLPESTRCVSCQAAWDGSNRR